MSMFTIVDFIRKKEEHRVFNRAVITTLINSGRLGGILCRDDYEAYQNINNCELQTFEQLVKSEKVYKWGVSSFYTIKELLFPKHHNDRIFTSATPFHYLLIVFFSFFNNKKNYIFMHGELGYLLSPVGLGQRLGAIFIKASFRFHSNKKVKFIAIGGYIKHKLNTRFNLSDESLVSVEHPVEYKSDFQSENVNVRNLCIGTFGVLSKEKSSEKIYELSNLLSSPIVLKTIGNSDGSFTYEENKNVTHVFRGNVHKDFIPTEQYESEVRKLKLAILFYDHEKKYGLTPSGIIHDCIAKRIPIIALENDYLRMLNSKFGDICILCSDLNDMSNAIDSCYASVGKIQVMEANIERLRESMSVESFSHSLLQVLDS